MQKLLVSLVLFLVPLSCLCTEDKQVITLENEVLHIVDGNPLAINGTTIGMMLHLRSEIGKRRFGIKGANGVMTGYYTFDSKKYTLIELVNLEALLSASNNVADQQKLVALQQFLDEVIKEEFIKLTEPFLADARGAKGQMVALLTEWATKARRLDTRLLAWANTQEGHETTALRERIKTVHDFELFCTDLVNFLESLMRSCPKACQQYKQIVEKQKQSHQQQQATQK